MKITKLFFFTYFIFSMIGCKNNNPTQLKKENSSKTNNQEITVAKRVDTILIDGIANEKTWKESTWLPINQVWMGKNLRTTTYKNGASINEDIHAGTGWHSYYNYDNDPANVEIYGRLYNWYTVSDERGICPVDFHIPSDDEYKELEMYLGLSQEEANAQSWRGTDEGGKMKDIGAEHWNSPNTGATNESGFTGLPAGWRHPSNGVYYEMNTVAFFWSSSEYDSYYAWNGVLYNELSVLGQGANFNKLWVYRAA